MNNNEIYGIIYMIKNNVNGKIYFGQTTKNKGFDERYCSGRWWQYSGNEHLVNSAKKYGEDNFVVYKQFDVAYSQDELDKLEDMYICLYNTMNPKYGYNKKRGGSLNDFLQGRSKKSTYRGYVWKYYKEEGDY